MLNSYLGPRVDQINIYIKISQIGYLNGCIQFYPMNFLVLSFSKKIYEVVKFDT